MSQAKEQPAARDDMIARPGFDAVMRGYDKRQVDQYVARVDSELTALMGERKRAFGQIQELGSHLKQVQAELTELHQRPPQLERASFRDLGPMVDQILALAEKQAEAITATAAEQAAQRHAKADKVLVEAREQADELRAVGETAREQAEQEATRINEESAQQLEHAKAEAEALIEAARVQMQQELAQWKANAERELTEQRNLANHKNSALAAEAQHYSADLRRRADEQAAAHQQQLTVVQHEIKARRQALTQLQTEFDAVQQRLAQSRQEGAAAENEFKDLKRRLGETTQELTSQLSRLEEAKRAGDSAERHAKDVRARVQREAERVANLAAAAVMAAAARGAETGEYPQVVQRPAENPPAAEAAQAPQPQANTNGHVRRDNENVVPAQPEKASPRLPN